MSEEKRKRGRPKTGLVTRSNDFHLRISDEEAEDLDRFSRIAGVNKSDFIRAAIESEKNRINEERKKKFAHLNHGSGDDEYGYFDEFDDV